jgi:hypothetical protein
MSMYHWRAIEWTRFVVDCRALRPASAPPSSDRQKQALRNLYVPEYVVNDLTAAEARRVIGQRIDETKRWIERQPPRNSPAPNTVGEALDGVPGTCDAAPLAPNRITNGSPRQISWAESIRDKASDELCHMIVDVENVMSDTSNQHFRDSLSRVIEILNRALGQKDATFWIAHNQRNDINQLLVDQARRDGITNIELDLAVLDLLAKGSAA